MNSSMSLVMNLEGTITGSSPLANIICGSTSLIGRRISEVLSDASGLIDGPVFGPVTMQTCLITDGQSIDVEAHLIETIDDPRILVTIRPLDEKSTVIPARPNDLAVNFDIADRRKTRPDLSEYAPQGLLLLTADFDYLYANRAMLDLVDRPVEEIRGRGWLATLHSDDITMLTDRIVARQNQLESTGQNYRLISPLGATSWVRASVRQVTMPDTPEAKYLIAFDDIDADKKRADRHMREATRDSVTGLPNRLHFDKEIARHISKKSGMRSIVALLYIDLDGFKAVNDLYGHAYGDMLLVAVADRLNESCSRASIVARLGGDEFVVLLTDVRRTEEIKYLAEKINMTLSQPFPIEGESISVSCSIGIATHYRMMEDRRSNDRIVGDLLRRADSAMYSAKHAGKNQYFIFGAEKAANIGGSSVRLIKDVYSAIEHNDLRMEYQPQIETATNTVVGYEGLVRWLHPVNGLVMPGDFIPLIETTGAMTELTTWITRRVCHDYVTKLVTNSALVRPTVSINLSAIQLQDMKMLTMIDNIIKNERVQPTDVVFEITESILVSDPVAGRKGLVWLRSKGYRTALDDFGTGYSSLAYLNDFPIDELKLDCSFIRGVETSAESRTLVSGIISLAHNLNMYVTAEGVEDAAQLAFLDAQDCDRCQGYYFSKSQTPQEIHELRAAG